MQRDFHHGLLGRNGDVFGFVVAALKLLFRFLKRLVGARQCGARIHFTGTNGRHAKAEAHRHLRSVPRDDVALDFPSQCKRHPELLLATGAGAGSAREASATVFGHWVVGPRPGASADWTAKETMPDAEGSEDVGFRCALDRELAHSRLDRGEYVSLP